MAALGAADCREGRVVEIGVAACAWGNSDPKQITEFGLLLCIYRYIYTFIDVPRVNPIGRGESLKLT